MNQPRTEQELAGALRRLGLGEGDTVVVHSSLRAFGPVAGGSEAAVRALLAVVGRTGTIAVPTYTYWTTRFDPNSDPSLTGRLTETIRRWPGAQRSWHPTHSVAALGAGAAEFVAGHHLMAANGIGSPFDRIAAAGGWVLLIGVAHNTNSTIHVGEAHARVPYLDVPFFPNSPRELTVVTPTGEITVPILQPSGCSKGFGAVERPLRQCGAVRDGIVGDALVQLVRGQAVIDTVKEMLRVDPGELLCTDPACYRCTQSRKLIERSANA